MEEHWSIEAQESFQFIEEIGSVESFITFNPLFFVQLLTLTTIVNLLPYASVAQSTRSLCVA